MDNVKKYGWSSAILYRIKLGIDKINNSWNTYLRNKMWRDQAKRLRRRTISRNDKRIVDRKLKKKIKEYCRDAFGSTSYWPWLALYTELRGEFKEGWLPLDYYYFELLPRMNPQKFMRFSEAKAIDHILFEEKIIEPLFFRLNRIYYDKDKIVRTKQEVEEKFYKLDSEIIIKPNGGKGGEGIIFKNSNELSLEELPEQTDLIFQKVVRQHDKMDELYPHSINTFRVLTFIDDDGTIEVKFIVIRFGQGEARVDNLSRSGGWIFVNQDGSVEPTSYGPYGKCMGKKHPDTGTIFSELKLPFIDKIVNLCKRAHRSFPYTRIIGWDVFVDEKGDPKLIEWNANKPFLMAIEAIFGPFFEKLIDY